METIKATMKEAIEQPKPEEDSDFGYISRLQQCIDRELDLIAWGMDNWYEKDTRND